MQRGYSVSEVADRLGVSLNTVRNWERQLPEFIPVARLEGGVRAYPEEAVKRLAKISLLREKGLPLEAIREVFTAFYERRDEAGLTVIPIRAPDSPPVVQLAEYLQNRLEGVCARQAESLRDYVDERMQEIGRRQAEILANVAEMREPRRERHRRRSVWSRLFGA